MQCDRCQYPNTHVVYTTRNHDLNQIYRRRECIKCGSRFTTMEQMRNNYKRLPIKQLSIRVITK